MLTRSGREAIREGPWWTFPLFAVIVLALTALLTVVAYAKDAQREVTWKDGSCRRSGGPGSFVACHLTITNLPSGPNAPLLHLRVGGPAHFTVNAKGEITEDFSPKIKRLHVR